MEPTPMEDAYEESFRAQEEHARLMAVVLLEKELEIRQEPTPPIEEPKIDVPPINLALFLPAKKNHTRKTRGKIVIRVLLSAKKRGLSIHNHKALGDRQEHNNEEVCEHWREEQ